MRIGIFADSHDHIDNVRRAVSEFNRRGCDLVVFAGDFVSPLVIPPLRALQCPLLACYGDNDGNKIGIAGGMRIVGTLGEPPFGFQTPDRTRILVAHSLDQLRDLIENSHVVISSHTHRAAVTRTESGRVFINPGETGGWVFRKPSIAILETPSLDVELVPLPEPPPIPSSRTPAKPVANRD